MRSKGRSEVSWSSVQPAAGRLLANTVHAILKAPLWFALLATSPKMPGGTFLQACVAAYGAWNKRSRRRVSPLLETTRRLRHCLPDPPMVMVLVACSGILLLPAGQPSEDSGAATGYGYASACVLPEQPACTLDSSETPVNRDAAAYALSLDPSSASCSIQRWWPSCPGGAPPCGATRVGKRRWS